MVGKGELIICDNFTCASHSLMILGRHSLVLVNDKNFLSISWVTTGLMQSSQMDNHHEAKQYDRRIVKHLL